MDKIDYKVECQTGCGEYKPFVPMGKYKVTVSDLILRTDPSKDSAKLSTLKKDEIVEVIEDTGKIETISFETAPWVKVKTAQGKIGYVFAGFLTWAEGVQSLYLESLKRWPMK